MASSSPSPSFLSVLHSAPDSLCQNPGLSSSLSPAFWQALPSSPVLTLEASDSVPHPIAQLFLTTTCLVPFPNASLMFLQELCLLLVLSFPLTHPISQHLGPSPRHSLSPDPLRLSSLPISLVLCFLLASELLRALSPHQTQF